jgi:3,4-dihydroxy 2-butanone 4-phosphate synthase/GTP cyclohydrolase II
MDLINKGAHRFSVLKKVVSIVRDVPKLAAIKPLYMRNGHSQAVFRRGTHSLVGDFDVQTQFGPFRSSVFYDDVSRDYLLAFSTPGIRRPVKANDGLPKSPGGTPVFATEDERAQLLFTRVHSSCITSETLGAMDCDCVEQLNGAFKKISIKGGVLFYLMQEGRGAGFVSKARGRMIEEADGTTTYDAYRSMGLRPDYREFDGVRAATTYLELAGSDWVLLTNNPLKTQSFKSLGIGTMQPRHLEYDYNPHNGGYLSSKRVFGHELSIVPEEGITDVAPPRKVVAIQPKRAWRDFILESQYFLPISPTEGCYLIPADRLETDFDSGQRETMAPFLKPKTAYGKSYYQFDTAQLPESVRVGLGAKMADLKFFPYWFEVNVFTDQGKSNRTYILLNYNDTQLAETPVVRVQSESIMNRIPLIRTPEKDKLRASIDYIIDKGHGCVAFYPDDGRGHGLGQFVRNIVNDQPLEETEDVRDYAFLGLIDHLFDSKPMEMISFSDKTESFHDAVSEWGLDLTWVKL